jgi:hypothetical protein
VEGPSDLQFWSNVLPKHFRGWQFDIRNMKNRDKLVRATPDLFEEFRNLRRRAAIIILDRDKDPCIQAVLNSFDPAALKAARKQPITERFLHICVAIRKIECWYLADAQAINTVITGAAWESPPETATCSGKREIEQLLQSRSRTPIGYNEIDFAKSIAPKFAPRRAETRSASFRYFWHRVSTICAA